MWLYVGMHCLGSVLHQSMVMEQWSIRHSQFDAFSAQALSETEAGPCGWKSEDTENMDASVSWISAYNRLRKATSSEVYWDEIWIRANQNKDSDFGILSPTDVWVSQTFDQATERIPCYLDKVFLLLRMFSWPQTNWNINFQMLKGALNLRKSKIRNLWKA